MAKQANPISANRGPVSRPEQANDDDRPFAEIRRNLNDLVRMLVLHRWAFFVPACCVASTAFVLSLFYPRTYRATTSFERRNDPIMVDLPNAAGAASFKYFRSTMSQDLTSVAYMADVVENLGLAKEFERDAEGNLTKGSIARRDALARALGSRVSISTSSPSQHIDTVRIVYTGPDPTIGKKLLDEVKRTYIRRTKTWMRAFLESQKQYFVQQLEEADKVMKVAQHEETKLRLENPYVYAKNPGAISTKLSELELEQRELSARKREYQEELSALQELFASAGPVAGEMSEDANLVTSITLESFASPETQQIVRDLNNLDAKIATLRATRGMTDRHPEIEAIRRERSALAARLGTHRAMDEKVSITSAPTAAMGQLAQIAAMQQPWRREQARLRVRIESQNAKLKDVEIRLDGNMLALEQVRDAKRNLYVRQDEFEDATAAVSKARRRHNEIGSTLARIEPAIAAIEKDRLVRFSHGEPARGGGIAVNPKAKTIVLLAVVTGLIAGVIFVVLAEILDNVYRSAGRVSRSLGIPILEAIDEIVTSQDRRRHIVRRAVVVPILVGSCLALTGLTGAMAYLSIERPWAYKRFQQIPEAALQLFAGSVRESESPSSES